MVLVWAALAAAAGPAQAALTAYTELSAFLAAVSAPGTDGFDDLASGASPSPLQRSAGPWAYRISVEPDTGFIGAGSPVPPGLVVAAGSAADSWLSTNTATDTLRLDPLGAVRAIGGRFFGSDVDGGFQPGATLSLQVADAGGVLTQTLASPTAGSFIGWVSDTDLLWLRASALQPAAGSHWASLNDLVLAAAPVPEPESWALMLSGLAGLAWLGRRRPRRAHNAA